MIYHTEKRMLGSFCGHEAWALGVVYRTYSVVKSAAGAWFITVAGGTSAGTDTDLAGGSDTGITWVAYPTIVGDFTTDDRVGLQLLLDAIHATNGELHLCSDRTYGVTRFSTSAYCLNKRNGRIYGHRSRIKQQGGMATSVRLFYDTGTDSQYFDLVCDGNKAAQSVNEQRHGIFAEGSIRMHIERCLFENFTGDGVYLYLNCEGVSVVNSVMINNDRNGLTFGANAKNTLMLGGHYYGNAAQQIDMEPGGGVPPSKTRMLGLYAKAGTTGDRTITISGSSAVLRGAMASVVGCTVDGSIHAVWHDDIAITGCHSENNTEYQNYSIYRHCERVAIVGNVGQQINAFTDNALVGMTAAGSGDQPVAIVVAGNALKSNGATTGVNCKGHESALVAANMLQGPGGASSGVGVLSRATAAENIRTTLISSNYMGNWGNSGAMVSGTGWSNWSAGVRYVGDVRRSASENKFFQVTKAANGITAPDWLAGVVRAINDKVTVPSTGKVFRATSAGTSAGNDTNLAGGSDTSVSWTEYVVGTSAGNDTNLAGGSDTGVLWGIYTTYKQLQPMVVGNMFDNIGGNQVNGLTMEDDVSSESCYSLVVGLNGTIGTTKGVRNARKNVPVLTSGMDGLEPVYGKPTKPVV